MPFKDLPQGQTHFENDGCGEPAHNKPPTIEEVMKSFRKKFGQFYVSIDAKTKAIRMVDIENGVKVNGDDGSKIECVSSGDIEDFLRTALSAQNEAVGREINETLEKRVIRLSKIEGDAKVRFDCYNEGIHEAQYIVSAITHNKEKE